MKKVIAFIIFMLVALLFSFTALCASETKADTKETSVSIADAETATTQEKKSEKLPRVKNVVFDSSDTSSVTFSWDKVEQAEVYHLYHYDSESEKFGYIGDTTDTTATVTALESGRTYKFRVRAVSFATGEKQQSKASETVVTVTAPEGTVKPKTKTITKDSVTLYWDKLPGATGYKVYYYDREKGKYTAYDHIKGGTSMTVEGLDENTFYSFKIRPYRWVGSAFSYGEYGDVYLEATDTSGTPRTYAQAAAAYNRLVNSLKKTQNMTVKYKKVIDTEFLLCDVESLTNSVKNTINLFDGTLERTYNFVGGKSGNVTPNSLFEPYKKSAGVERDDIENFYVKKYDDGYTLKVVLKSEERFFDSENKNGDIKSYYDNAISLPDYKKLNTKPLKIKKADSYYSDGKLIFRVKNGEMTVLKIRCSVMSSIDFSVSSLDANSAIVYILSEDYRMSR